MESNTSKTYRVATVGSPRGLGGEVRLLLHTDNPSQRLAPGMQLATDPDVGTLTVADLTRRQDDWYAQFEGYPDRTAVEELVHTVLKAPGVAEEDAWYLDELAGLTVHDPQGEVLGTVVGLEHYPAHDLLVVQEPTTTRTMVPFVKDIVHQVDLEDRVIVVDPPGGLFTAQQRGQ